MFFKFFFSRMSMERKVSYLRKKGMLLGTRLKNSRKIYIYMLNDLFVEVTFRDDSTDNSPEEVQIITGLRNLNEHLGQAFKTSF